MATDPTAAAGPSPFQTVVASYDDRSAQAPAPQPDQAPAHEPADVGSFGVGQQVNTGA